MAALAASFSLRLHVIDATPGRHQRSEAVEPLACVCRRLLRGFVRRTGLLPGDDARAIGQWAHGGAFAVEGSVRIEATLPRSEITSRHQV